MLVCVQCLSAQHCVQVINLKIIPFCVPKTFFLFFLPWYRQVGYRVSFLNSSIVAYATKAKCLNSGIVTTWARLTYTELQVQVKPTFSTYKRLQQQTKKMIYQAILNYGIFRFWSPMPAPPSAGTRVSRGEQRRASCSRQYAAALYRYFQELSALPCAAVAMLSPLYRPSYGILTAASSQHKWEFYLMTHSRVHYDYQSLIWVGFLLDLFCSLLFYLLFILSRII